MAKIYETKQDVERSHLKSEQVHLSAGKETILYSGLIATAISFLGFSWMI